MTEYTHVGGDGFEYRYSSSPDEHGVCLDIATDSNLRVLRTEPRVRHYACVVALNWFFAVACNIHHGWYSDAMAIATGPLAVVIVSWIYKSGRKGI